MPVQIDAIELNGQMDLDTPNEVIQRSAIRGSRNVLWRGSPPNVRYESVPGTTLVPNALLPATGMNLTIKAHYDAVRKRVFFWNYNSGGTNGIYVYFTQTGTFQRLIQTGLNTVGDPLGFTATGRISSVDILYGDQITGDILFFVDSLGRPTQINIQRYLSGTYPAIQRTFIDVAKAPPVMPPQVTYENDYTVTVNNLTNSLWQFSYIFIYDNFEKSVLSSGSILPLPTIPFDPNKNIDKSQNARIGVYVQTGDATVKQIRIYGKRIFNGVSSGWLILDTLKKTDYGIADNTVYKYLFYGNGNYVAEDVTFAGLDSDKVPIKANCQVMLNGSVISYAGITEGYDFLTPSLVITSANQPVARYTVNGVLFFAAFNGQSTGGQPQVTLYLTGAGDNDGSGNPVNLYWPPQNLVVTAGGSGVGFSYVNSLLTSPNAILTQLAAAAVAAGWVQVGAVGTNSFTIYYPTGTYSLTSSYVQGQAVQPTFPYNFPQLALLPQAAYQWGVVYRDQYGRTNGVISWLNGQNTTPAQSASQQTAEVTINISNPPPSWAYYYHIVRTDNLTYNKYLAWATTGAIANTIGQKQYVYFNIQNLFDYNTQLGATQGVISYGFAQGDRIKITGRYDAQSNFTSLNLDYAVLGFVTNPTVNGQTQVGSFIQIAYPAADIGPNFQFPTPSDSNFQNYQILIYSYKSQNPQGQNVFYEVGQEYAIINPGTINAFHAGNISPGVTKLTDGDFFYRPRTVPLTNSYSVPTGSYTQGSPYGTVWVNPGAEGVPVVDNGIWRIRGDFNKVAGLDAAHYPTYVDNNYTILNESASITFSVRIRWTVNITDTTDPNGQWQMFFKIVSPGNVIRVITASQLFTGLKVGVANQYNIDVTFTMGPGDKMWLVNFAQNQMFVAGGPLQIDIIRNATFMVYDASFSDIYALKTNSDNRPNLINATSKQTFNGVLFRYSQPLQIGTDINNTNRFYDLNFDTFEGSYGSVIRMIVWQRRLRIAQERKWAEKGIYSKYLKNNTGDLTLMASNTIIDPNNIMYFDGDFGIGNQPDCIAVNGFQIWFVDPIRGAICRLSLDGIKQISEEFKVQTFAGATIPQYLKQFNYPFGGNSSILATYNFVKDRDSEVLFSFQGGSGPNGTLQGQTLSFVERPNYFNSFLDFAPDSITCAENQLISFSNGQMYIHNNTNSNGYCNYYGNSFLPSITFVSNPQLLIKKKYFAMGYQSFNSKIWAAKNIGDIFTSFANPQTGLTQQSQLIAQDFEVNEGVVYAAFLRDFNSGVNGALALLEGDYLLGNWLQYTLTAPDNNFNWLCLPFCTWLPSPKNP